MATSEIRVREAREEDVPAIREIFDAVYGQSYPHREFAEAGWLKGAIYNENILMLVAEDEQQQVLGTASVLFDKGAHSDLIGEFGRLAVRADSWGRGVGRQLMAKRIEFVRDRLQVGIVDNRCVHPYSQQISEKTGFSPAGFIPMRNCFAHRESMALYVQHFGQALSMRRNNPRIVPEAHSLAHQVLENCGLPTAAIVDEESPPYPRAGDYALEDLTTHGLPSLLRIERGRVRNREIFGPMRLQYGFFRLEARHAHYVLARERTDSGSGPICAAVGYIEDKDDRAVRIFELIGRDDDAIRFPLARLVKRSTPERGVEFMEVDVSAYAPRMQRTLLELGFLPAAYLPAGVFYEVERLDVIKMVKLLVPVDLGEIHLVPRARELADIVMPPFSRREVLPRISAAVHLVDAFQGLSDDHVTSIAAACSLREFAEGEVLFHAGEAAAELCFPLSGEVRVSLPGGREGTVARGGCLGEFSLLTGEPHSATAAAAGPLQVAVLAEERLRELIRHRPGIGVALYRNLAVGLVRKLQRLDESQTAD